MAPGQAPGCIHPILIDTQNLGDFAGVSAYALAFPSMGWEWARLLGVSTRNTKKPIWGPGSWVYPPENEKNQIHLLPTQDIRKFITFGQVKSKLKFFLLLTADTGNDFLEQDILNSDHFEFRFRDFDCPEGYFGPFPASFR